MTSPTPAPAAVPTHPRIAWLAGSTGLVGSALLPLLLDDPACSAVHALVRRLPEHPRTHTKLTLHPVDFGHLPVLPACDDAYIALGTTIRVAGSREAFRKVDLDAVVATARAAREAGATRLGVVSALGADATSSVFYNRVKGEMEAAAAALGFDTIVFARPSLLLGDRAALGQPVRLAETWSERLLRPVMGLVPARVRPIEATAVATALVHALKHSPHGVHRLESIAMQPARGRM